MENKQPIVLRKNFRFVCFGILLLFAFVFSLFYWNLISNNKDEKEYKGYITLWFDDGMQSTYDIAYPIIKKNGWIAVLAVISDRNVALEKYEEVDSVMTWEQVIDIQNNGGWEISNHSLSHSHLNSIENKPELEREILLPLEVLRSKSLNVRSFTFPYGEQGNILGQEIVSDNHGYWRSSVPGINPIPAWRHLTAYFFNEDTTEEEVIDLIRKTEDSGGWLILGLHSTLRNPVTEWEHTPNQLKSLLKIIDDSTLEVVVPSDLFDKFGYAEDK